MIYLHQEKMTCFFTFEMKLEGVAQEDLLIIQMSTNYEDSPSKAGDSLSVGCRKSVIFEWVPMTDMNDRH